MQGAAAATGPEPAPKRARWVGNDSQAAAAAGPDRGRVAKVLLDWLVGRLCATPVSLRDFWERDRRRPLEDRVMARTAASLLEAGLGGPEHVAVLVDVFDPMRSDALNDDDPVYGTFAPPFEPIVRALKAAPSPLVIPHLERIMGPPAERVSRAWDQMQQHACVHENVLSIAHAHIQPLLSACDVQETAHTTAESAKQQQKQQEKPAAAKQQQGAQAMASKAKTPMHGMDPAAAPAVVARYVRMVEDCLWLSTKYYSAGLETLALEAFERIPRPLVFQHADVLGSIIMPSVKIIQERGNPGAAANRLAKLLRVVSGVDFVPEHTEAVVAMLRFGAAEHRPLVASVVSKLKEFVKGGGSLTLLAPMVGDLLGGIRGGKEAEATNKAILKVLKAIPPDAFGPMPTEDGAGGGGGGGSSNSSSSSTTTTSTSRTSRTSSSTAPSPAPSPALEGLLALMCSDERGGLASNSERTQAVRALPLDRIFKAHMGRVFDALRKTMRKAREGGYRSGGESALLGAAYASLGLLPPAWLFPHWLELRTDAQFENEREMVYAMRLVGNLDEQTACIDAHADALLELVKEKGEAAADFDRKVERYGLLKQLMLFMSDDAWLGLKEDIKEMAEDEEFTCEGMLLMRHLHEKYPPLATDDEMDAAIADGFEHDWHGCVLRAFEVSATYEGRRRAHRAKVIEPHVPLILNTVVDHLSARSIRVLETFCSASSGLRPLLLDCLGDVLLPILNKYPTTKPATAAAAIKVLAELPAAALEPFVGDVVKLLERISGNAATVRVQIAALELLERLPVRATRDYTTLILRASTKAAQAAQQAASMMGFGGSVSDEERQEEEGDDDECGE